MNILFVTIAWPEKGERNLYSDLIDEFVRNGHEVFVLCAEADGPGCPPVKENEINVLRVPTLQIRKVKKISKAIALFSLGSKMFRSALKNWSGLRIDLIIGHSPPVTLSGLYRRLKSWYNSPVYYLLKDIWPHGPADLGLIQRNGIIFRFFRYHEVRMYKIADYIGCMSEMNVDYIIRENRYLNPEKVEVCPNTISPRALEIKEDVKGIRNRHNIPENATVFIFSGNLGKAHGLDFYINVIESLKDYERAFFLIGGSGLYY
ncbi:MAG: glycosyltransferase family 4 protein, partial [Bacteroidales bacterium]|nr:glycosyltransferase family 4 protein [Bacteroidales bacterium]